MPRFVILLHECSPGDEGGNHWDLMLEPPSRSGGTVKLATWALFSEPQPGAPISAQRLPDHRELYLDYEGPISGNRGRVARVIWGQVEWIQFGGAFQVAYLRHQRGVWKVEIAEHADQRCFVEFYRCDEPSNGLSG